MGSLDGKAVLITGANGELGRAVTQSFLDAGARVAGAARKISDADFPSPAFKGIAADVATETGAASLVSSVQSEFGRIDILVHLVGTWKGGKTHETELAKFDELLAVNLRSAFLMIREVLKPMQTQGSGRILAIGARPAVEPAPGSAAYGASKAALVSLIRTVAAENRESGITANIVLPSTIDTTANRKAMPSADYKKWVDPKQIAALLVHLAGDEASAISGAAIPIYGGEG